MTMSVKAPCSTSLTDIHVIPIINFLVGFKVSTGTKFGSFSYVAVDIIFVVLGKLKDGILFFVRK